MSERRSPLEALVDLVVYAPLGLALTVAEDLPGLAAKGRAKIEPQLGTARLVGQFAVAEGRRRAFRATRPSATPTRAARVAERRSSPAGPGREPDPGSSPGATTTAGPGASPTARSLAGAAAGSTPTVASGRETERAAPGSPEAPSPAGLAIPGYDSLSASQVVQRLDGLSSAELAAVGDYEAATRGRRTILARVSQLQGR